MRIVRSTRVESRDRGASAAIGNFDGVHLGHKAVLDRARGPAPLGVVTFEPHPRELFAPHAPPFRLMTSGSRAHRLERLGTELLFELPFERIATLEAEAFAHDVLAGGLGLSRATVGRDFHFGRGRAGSAETLVEYGARYGFDVTVVDLIRLDAGEVSSTRIREALSDGYPREAARLLGHLHRIEGPVLHGAKRGRALGYPTANVSVDRLHLPRFGVYAVKVDILTGPLRANIRGVASIGVRPMFGEEKPNLEVHLFDFTGDLYEETLSVALVEFLRPEARFSDVSALIAQMDADSARARDILAA